MTMEEKNQQGTVFAMVKKKKKKDRYQIALVFKQKP